MEQLFTPQVLGTIITVLLIIIGSVGVLFKWMTSSYGTIIGNLQNQLNWVTTDMRGRIIELEKKLTDNEDLCRKRLDEMESSYKRKMDDCIDEIAKLKKAGVSLSDGKLINPLP